MSKLIVVFTGAFKVSHMLMKIAHLRMMLAINLSFISRIRFQIQMNMNFMEQIGNKISTMYQFTNIADHV